MAIGNRRGRVVLANLLFLLMIGIGVGILLASAPGSGTTGPPRAIAQNAELHPHIPGEVLLRFEDDADEEQRQAIRAALGAHKRRELGRAIEHLILGPGLTTEQAIAIYGQHPLIRYVEPNYIVSVDILPNDPRFPELYGLNNTGQTGGTPGADIAAEQAWDVSTGSNQVIVGVIDSGIDYTHPDLAANIWTNPGEMPDNGIDDDGNGYVDDVRGWDFANQDNDPWDDHSHGTHVAGTIGAVGDNGVGVSGVNWKVRLVPLKFLHSSGSGSTSDAILAVEYATAIGADVVNNSWGGGGFSQALLDAIEAAAEADVLFVASAGNQGLDTDLFPHFPSSYEAVNVVSVAATDHNDFKASFSNFGLTSVDLGAPGVDILSTLPGSSYGWKGGTSMAAPHVSGAAALIRAVAPHLGVVDLKNLLLNNTVPLPSLDGNTVTGGRLSAFLPIAVQDETAPGAIDDLTAETPASNSIFLRWTSTGDDALDGTATLYDLRYAATPIDGLSYFTATRVSGLPRPQAPGSLEVAEVLGLQPLTTYYFALKAVDEWGNAGALSNVVFETTLPPPTFASSPASFDVALFEGQTTTRALTIRNAGVGALDWRILDLPAGTAGPGAQELSLFLPKGEDDSRRGAAVTAGTGGPDTFGYRFISSDEPGGPSSVWRDIALIGSPILELDGDDQLSEPIPLGFEFPFYGGKYDHIQVCTNGWLSFAGSTTAYTNQPLPTTASPETLIAPFWDDLDFQGGYRAVYARENDSFTVQFIDVPRFSGPGTYTFQVTLSASGEVVFRYGRSSGDLSHATVGIQSGNAGLQVAFNTTFVRDQFAVAITNADQWLQADPTAGRLFGGDSEEVVLTIETRGLDPAAYTASVDVETNDPSNPLVSHPVTLLVTGAPAIEVVPTVLEFGELFVENSLTLPLEVRNFGTETLIVHGITTGDPAVTVTPTTLTLPADSSQIVDVSFTPTVPGVLQSILTIDSNAPNGPLLEVPTVGSAALPPAIDVAPAAFSETLFTGQSVTRNLRIDNTGASDLIVALSFGPASGSEKTDSTSWLINPGFETGDFTGWTATSNGLGQLTPWTVSRGGAGWFGNSSELEGEFDALNGFDGTAGLEYDLIQPISIPSSAFRAELSYADRIQFDSLGIFSSAPRLYEATIEDLDGTVLAQIIREEIWLNGAGYTDLGWQRRSVDLVPFAGQTVQLHIHEFIPEDYTGPALIEFDDFQIDSEGFPVWLHPSVTSATVPPGQFADLGLTFDAGGSASALFEGSIRIGTNVPATPAVFVPVELTVIGAPDIVIAGAPVVAQSTENFAASGATTRHTLPVTPPPAGGGTLELTVTGDFDGSTEFATLVAEGIALGSVGSTGVPCGSGSTEFDLSRAELAELAADGIVEAEAGNSINVDPTCPTNAHTVSLRYIASLESLDFGAVFTGASLDMAITIRNEGTDPLDVNSIATDLPEFTLSNSALSIPPGGQEPVTITFAPGRVGAFDGTLSVISNDPDTPAVSFPLTGVGADPPIIGLAPAALDSTLLSGEQENRTLTISNSGGSPLEFVLSVVSSGPAANGPDTETEPVFELLRPSPVPLTCVVGDLSTQQIYGQANQGTAFYRYDVALDAWAQVTSAPLNSGNNCGADLLDGKIYTSYTGSPAMGVYDIATDTWSVITGAVADTANIASDGQTYLYQVGGRSAARFDAATLQAESLATPPFSFERWGGLRHLGGVLYGHQGNSWTGFAMYDIASDRWSVLPSVPGGAVLGAAIDPLARQYYAYGSYGGRDFYRYTIDSASWDVLSIPFFSVNDGGLVWLSDPYSAVYFTEGENGTQFARLKLATPFVQVDPLTGVVPPLGAVDVAVLFDATDRPPGLYQADIVVASNDPSTPLATAPISLTVAGVPDITVLGDNVVVQSSRDYTSSGAVTTHSLPITSTPAGGGSLEMVVDGDFGDPGELATMLVEGQQFGQVGATGSDCTAVGAAVPVDAATLATLAADGVVDVEVFNASSVDAICETNKHTVRLEYNTALGLLDFGATQIGSSRELAVVIENGGTDTLQVSSITTDVAEFVPSVASLDIPAGQSERVVVLFMPTSVVDLTATLTIASNDPDTPTISVPLVGSGVEPPIIGVDPADLNLTLPEGALESRILTLSNTGLGPLDFSLSAEPPANPRVTFDPVNGTVPAGGSLAVSVTFDTTAVPVGIHATEVRVASNDPVTPLVIVPVTLTVFGAPSIAVEGDTVAVESIQNYVGAGARTSHSLPVADPIAGGARIELIAEGDFGDSIERATATAEGIVLGSAGSSGIDCTPAANLFNIGPGDLGALIADGVVEVEVQNDSSVGDFCGTNRHTVRFVYRTPADRLDFGTTFVLATEVLSFIISNNGTDLLEVGSITSDLPEFSASPATLSLAPGQLAVVTVSFTPSSAATFAGTLSIASNDPDTPLIGIPLSGDGAERPVISVDPPAIDITLLQGEQANRTLTLSNSGPGPLEFALNVVPSSATFVTLDPIAGTVPPSGTLDVTVGFDTAGLPVGTQLAEIEISSNDPLSPVVAVPLTLVVAGIPDIVVGSIPVTLESTQSFSTSGATTVHLLPVPSQPGGGGIVRLTVNGDFGGSDETATATAEGLVVGTVGASGFDCEEVSEQFLVSAADLAALTADGTVEVEVQNSSSVGTFCESNYHTVRLDYIEPADRLDFGTVRTDSFRELTLIVENGGTDLLVVGSVASDLPEFSPSAASLNVAPGESRTLTVRFEPSGATEFNGTLSIASNDPDTPVITIPLSGRGADPPQLAVAPGGLDLTLLAGANQTELLNISNNGGVPLDFTLDLDPAVSWLSMNPVSGSVPPASFADVAVVFDAGDLVAGIFQTTIVVLSNDPNDPSLTVPVSLTVTGVPDIAIGGESLVLESIVSYVTNGATTVHPLTIVQPPAGRGLVELIADGAFGAAENTATAITEGLELGSVGGMGADCVPALGEFPLSATDLAAQAGDGTVQVEVRNSPSVATICVRNEHTVRLRYHPVVDRLDFGVVLLGNSADLALVIENTGTEFLDVSSIASDDPTVTPSTTTLSIAPRSAETVTLTFAPAGITTLAGTLTIVSDDPDSPTIALPLAGEAAEPPVLGFDPPALAATVFAGGTDARVLTISNSGGSPLEFELTGVPVSLESGASLEQLDFEFELLRSSPVPLTCVIGDPETGLVYGQANQGTAFYRYVVATNTWEQLASAPLHSGNNGGATLLNGKIYTSYTEQSRIGRYDIAGDSWTTIPSPIPGTANIASDGASFIYLVRATIGRKMDPVSGVVSQIRTPAFSFAQWGGFRHLDGLIYGHQGSGKTNFGAYDVSADAWSTLPSLPSGAVAGATIDPVNRRYYTYGPAGGQNLYRFSFDTASWELLSAPFVVNDGGLVWLSRPTPAVYMVQGEDGTGFAKLVTRIPFLGLDPAAGSVPPAGAVNVNVTLDASGLPAGLHEAEIAISSNDPVTPLAAVPVTLDVIGAPRLRVGGQPVTFESTQSYDSSGAMTNHAFAVTDPPAGDGSVQLIADGDFGAPTEQASLSAEGKVVGIVGSVGTDCRPAASTFPIFAVDLATLVQDGLIEFEVQNSTDVGAACSTNSHTVRLTYAGVLDQLDFDSVLIGSSRDLSITVENTGTDVLQISSVATDSAAFSPSTSSLTLAPGESRILTVSFNPTGPGDHPGTLTILSNDPDTPVFDVPLTGVGVEPPVIGVAPPVIEATLFEGSQTTQILTISNTGNGPLEFLLSVVPSPVGFVTPDPQSGIVPPSGSEDVLVTLDSQGLAVGTHAAVLSIASNDPVTPEVNVTVSLVVLGAPSILVRSEPLTVESVKDYFVSGAQTAHTLPITTPPSAGGSLELIADGDFGASSETASVTVEGITLGFAGAVGGDCLPASEIFEIDAGLMQSIVADGVVGVEVQNSGAVDPHCATNRHTVRLHYSLPLDRIDFGDVLLSLSDQRSIRIANTGTEVLEVSSIAAGLPEFVVSSSALSLPPGAEESVTITFTPSNIASFDTTLTITSNDAGSPLVIFPLSGRGVEPPIVGVEPAELISVLSEGEQETRTLTLSNTGGSDLQFSIDVLPAAAVAVSFAGMSEDDAAPSGNASPAQGGDDPSEPEEPQTPSPAVGLKAWYQQLSSSPAALTCVVADPARNHLYAQETGGRSFHRYVASTDTWERLADASLDSENNCGAVLLNDKVYTAYAENGSSLGVYDIATGSWSTTPHPSGIETADIAGDGQRHLYLAAEHDLVRFEPESEEVALLAAPPIRFDRWGGLSYLEGVIYGHQGNGGIGFAAYDVAADDWTVLPPLPAGGVLGAAIDPLSREYVTMGSYGGRNLYRYSIDSAAWSVSTLPYVGVDDGGAGWLSGPVPGVLFVQGQGGTGFYRLIGEGLADVSFLNVMPEFGSVQPNDSLTINAFFDAATLTPGLFEAVVVIQTNDPVAPTVEVPASLDVLGRPDIALPGERVELESIVDYNTDGALTTHDLMVTLAPAGGATVELIADGDFGLLSETATITAEDLLLGSVGGTGNDCTPASDTFFINPREFARMVDDGVVGIEVQNSPDVGRFCIPDRHTVRLAFETPLEQIDFGTVFTGYSGVVPLLIRNDGTGSLHISSISSDSPEVVVSSSALTVPILSFVELQLSYTPTGAGPLTATLSIASDDPDEPVVLVELVGQALDPPVAEVDPASLVAALPPRSALAKTRTIRLSNTGGSDLFWSAETLQGFGPPEAAAEWVPRPKGDESDNGAGELSVERFGGPDAFGYRFRDSDEIDGPVFAWEEISQTGTAVPLTGDDQIWGPLAIGFDFPYYGETFRTLNISSNGWISFTSVKTSFSNPDALPNSAFSVPENLIAPFWDDLHLRGEPRITYHADCNRFVVQYSNVDRFASEADLTFQVILYPSGQIVLQYLSMAGTLDSATIGVQNSDKSIGLLVAYNESYVHDDFAVELAPIVSWATTDPASGILTPGGSEEITVDVGSTDLDEGDFEAQVSIRSNDPQRGQIVVPLTLHVREIDLDWFDIDPNTLNLSSNGTKVRGALQLPPGYDPRQVVISSVSLYGVLFADPAPIEFADENGDGVDELILHFDRAAFQSLVPEGDQVPVTVTGEVADTVWFKGTDTIRAIRPTVTHPNGGELVATGAVVSVSWDPPDWPRAVTYVVLLSRDGGVSWEELAADVAATSYPWSVVGAGTTRARIRVFAIDNGEVLGSDTSDSDFAIDGPALPPGRVTTLRVSSSDADVVLDWQRPAPDSVHGPVEFYRILRSTSAQGPFDEIATTPMESYADPLAGQPAGGTIFYRVEAVNGAGTEGGN